MPQCTKCQTISDNFTQDPRKINGLASQCRKCKNLYDAQRAEKRQSYFSIYKKNNPQKYTQSSAKHKAAKLLRCPNWLTELHLTQIQIFYDSARALTAEFGIPMEVDHIIPLQGKNVSGLHVPWNLQVITKKENCFYGNRVKVG